MKYANFKDTGRRSVNIGDYMQFMAADFLLKQMNVPDRDIVYLGFHDIGQYSGEEVVFPFATPSLILYPTGKSTSLTKSNRFFAVTLSTVDKFMDTDQFLNDEHNHAYLIKHAPIGCRDEITYRMLTAHGIPAYINGCMTAVLPKYTGRPGNKVLFVDAPKSLLPYIPNTLLENCEFSTQQYYFEQSEILNFKKMFAFVEDKYRGYQQNAKLVITSRLHVALPLAAFGISVILAKDRVDGRFSFIEEYIPIYGKERYTEINWSTTPPDMEQMKAVLIRHALGRLQGNMNEVELRRIEWELTNQFLARNIKSVYQSSHETTHHNGLFFDTYAAKYWRKDKPIKYAFWGISQNNLEYWKTHIENRYPLATLTAVFDSFQDGQLLGFPYQRPEMIAHYPDIYVIVCSVGAAQAARKCFNEWNIDKRRYCIASDCFIGPDDIAEREGIVYDLYSNDCI